jgi:hypothetical protein
MRWKLPRHVGLLVLAALTLAVAAPIVLAGHATPGADVNVINDNNNIDGGTPNPSFDAANRQSNETTVSISPANPSIVAAGGNDYRMVPVTADVWFGVYVSSDGGGSWFNTMVPGFPSDTSPAGTASPLLNLDASGDPVVRFDAAGNLYAAGIAFNRNFDQPDKQDNVVYVARYDYTPGSPAGTSTPSSAGNPPNFTYAQTTLVGRGAVGFAVPHQKFGFAGRFVDKEWMEIDTNSQSASPCAGSIYVAWTDFRGVGGASPIRFSRSTDGGKTFSPAKPISTGGQGGTRSNEGADIAVAPNGTIYVAYHSSGQGVDASGIGIVRSTNCGKSWSQPVLVNAITSGQAPGVAFRTPTFAFVSTDTTNSNVVYVAYQDLGADGDYDVFVQRSVNGGATWGPAVQVHDDPGGKHQIFPTIDVSNGALHVGWYDFRNSLTAANEALDVYYACTNCDGLVWPAFSHVTRVTDVSHNGNCLLFGGGTAAFHGDYNELDARWTGANHEVHVAWADNRDVSPCDLDPAAGPASNNTGNRNQNIYADRITVSP